MLAPLCAVLALAVAAPVRHPGPGRRPPVAHHSKVRAARAEPSLATARAALRAVQRDPVKRRYRHHWERAIRGLERAARGRDAGEALLEAARARYALYRFSSVESDRDAALALAARARRAGAREAAGFAAAVRREAGDHDPRDDAAAAAVRPSAPSAAPPHAARGRGAPTAEAAEPADEPPSTDPVLDRVIAQVTAEVAQGEAAAPPAGPPQRDPALDEILAQIAAAPGPGDDAARGPVRRVVIDAGHGGHDTGAIGPTQVREKDVALAIARKLASRLRAAGVDVVLTRDDDRFLELSRRTAIANQSGAQLFVSIHANAHPRRDRRGVETYVLDLAHDRYAKRLAARENGVLSDDGEAPEVRRILADLDAKASAAPSRRLATRVQRELCAGIRARFGDVRDLGVKSALFYVLLGARMPAVLVETSFLSNAVEERRLASARFQDEVAAGLARAIREHVAQEARVAAAR